MNLEATTRLQAPLSLRELRECEQEIRAIQLGQATREQRAVYQPFVFHAERALRPQQGYLTAFPQALVAYFNVLGDVSNRIAYSSAAIFEGPELEHEIRVGLHDELISLLARYPEERFSLDWRVFEELCAELLDKKGYQVTLTPRSGDKGRDILAVDRSGVAPTLMLVECKRYARRRLVGPEPISRIWTRLFDDHANLGMVVTTSGFTRAAKETAGNRGYQLSLKDGNDFMAWIRSIKS